MALRLVQARLEGLLQMDVAILDEALADYLDSSAIQATRALVIQAANVLNSKGVPEKGADLLVSTFLDDALPFSEKFF